MALARPEETFVRSDTELIGLWHDLMGEGGFGRRSLWMIFIEPDGQLSPVISPIDDLPDEPDDLFLRNLATIVTDLAADMGGTVAFLLSRPGGAEMTTSDRHWARAVRAAVRGTVSPWPVHLATCDRVRIFAPDDLL